MPRIYGVARLLERLWFRLLRTVLGGMRYNTIYFFLFSSFQARFSDIEAAAVTSRLNAAGLLKKKRRQEVYEPPL